MIDSYAQHLEKLNSTRRRISVAEQLDRKIKILERYGIVKALLALSQGAMEQKTDGSITRVTFTVDRPAFLELADAMNAQNTKAIRWRIIGFEVTFATTVPFQESE